MLLEITGNPNVGFNEEDIEGDFDPKKYDEAMQVSNNYKHDIFPIVSCFTCGTRKALLCFWISIIANEPSERRRSDGEAAAE